MRRSLRLPSRFFAYGTLGATLLLVGSLAILGTGTGCYGDQCIGDNVNFGDKEGEGRLVSPDIWESQPQSATNWMSYSHQRLYTVHPRGLEGRDILQVFPYISPDTNPNEISQWTLAGGNLGEIKILDTNVPGLVPTVLVKNDTCADYFIRIVIQAYPAAPPTDAGTPNSGDAGPDSNLDATTDTGVTE